ncbi:uncharacterized protein LOC122499929 [Leptopilina heterotoma]|uniref:uncharacterized protein LOC122499929 n=1 Tax=Leptopilina heterotoma TaxID=63436 RepID=UPI001CA898F1|nr:uncharacterized protein LOC122499929 [Leptopilina heterotoma]
MTFDNLANPIEAVSLIPIYTYFNLLSDFLFSENYLSIDDRQREIPVVNGLYKYFKERPNNTEELIRSLLQGSDLYGEKSDETLDEVFVNTMFDHIISSFVFSKFGNIYGFLAEVVRKTDSLIIDDLLQKIKTSLSNSIFQNENGNISSLTPLAVDRIFTDLISPLFPKSNTNFQLLSLDYIYAQAGSILLKSGRLNATYYSNFFTEKFVIGNETLFDEYLLTGHLLEELIIAEKIDPFNVTAFALSALFLYVYKERLTLEGEKTINIITDPEHWRKAYSFLFSFLDSTYNKITSLLKTDTKYNLHFELSQFKTSIILAQYFLDDDPICKLKTDDERYQLILTYLKKPNTFQCKIGQTLPNLKNYFLDSINNIIEAYRKFEKKLITVTLKDYFQSWDSKTEVLIILVDYNSTSSVLKNVTKGSYDLFGLYFPNNNNITFLTLLRGNYDAKVIRTEEQPEIFQPIPRTSIRNFDPKNSIFDQIDRIADKIVQNRCDRLKALILNTHEILRNNWWQEYSLSLVPFYPCLSGKMLHGLYKEEDPCKVDTFTMYPIQKEEKDHISLNLIEKETRNLLTAMGTSIKTLSLKKLIRKVMKSDEKSHLQTFHEYVKYERYSKVLQNQLILNSEKVLILSKFWNDSEPKVKYIINILEDNVRRLKILTSLDYKSIFGMLKNIEKFFVEYQIISFGKPNYSNLDLHVMSNSPYGHSGYGYKFIVLNESRAASLRTIDEHGMLKTKLFLLHKNISPDEKEFKLINGTTLKATNKTLYEVDQKFQYSLRRLQFSGTDVADYNLIECNRNKTEETPKCWRLKNREKQELIENEILNMSLIQMPHIPKEDLPKILKYYIFPEENFNVNEFFLLWKDAESYSIPQFAKKYIIDHRDDFLKLKYSEYLDEENLKINHLATRINRIYTNEERNLIEMRMTFKSIVEEYEYNNERFSATFEDYYALRNFGTTGHRRINRDTNEAKRMKIALYNLAIRQSDDPVENFDLTLTSLELMRTQSIEKLFSNQSEYILQKFTTTDKKVVNKPVNHRKDVEYVLLNMEFSKTYLRAKIQQKLCFVHPKTILLPGSKFSIEGREFVTIRDVGYVWKVHLKYIHVPDEKYLWYQKIMKTIIDIK